jgi:sigma-E factor negative regulatory protein RseB
VAVVFTALFGLAANAACPVADQEALRWLDRMSRSAIEADYQGVATLQRGDEMQVLQLSHSVESGAESEHLVHLTGRGAAIERSGHPLDCVHPGHQLLRLAETLEGSDCGVASHYRFGVTEAERVAGRDAVRILVDPRDPYRYGYVLDLDKETALLLRARIVGRGNTTLELFQFAKVNYAGGEPVVSPAEAMHQAAHPAPAESAGTALPRRDWFLSWLPEGFMPAGPLSGSGSSRAYTDGLAVFSVFLEELDREMRPGEGVVRQGATISYTRGMQLAREPVLVTVIGEIPVNTARMVVDSIGWAR